MPTFISFKDMADALREELKTNVRERLQFASMVALTRTAIACREEMKEHIKKAFDRPTPYAVNAARAVPATPARMASAVLLREFGKGTPAEYFLGPEIVGGPRRNKRFEKSFSAVGIMSPGGFATPGSAAAMDRYGNQKPAEIVQILSILRAFGEQGYRANRVKGWEGQTQVGQIFVVRQGANRLGLKPGVYRRTGTGRRRDGVECLMRFVRKPPSYRVRLPFNDLVQKDAAKFFEPELIKALEDEAATQGKVHGSTWNKYFAG